MSGELDHDQLVADIEAEVRRRREAGDVPPGLERELDMIFARFAPVSAIGGDFHQVLARAEESTLIDIFAPIESSRPVIPELKRVVRKAMIWEIRHVTQQVMAFANAITRAVRLLGERVDALEAAAPAGGAAALDAGQSAPSLAAAEHWASQLAPVLAGQEGRVLHAEAGDGRLVGLLVAAGIDAYGVQSTDVVTGAEVHLDDVVTHLRGLATGVLGGIVLSGIVDRAPVAAKIDLVEQAVAALRPGGALVVIGSDPSTWERDHPPVEVDLSPGRPLHSATWQHLLERAGLERASVFAGPPAPGAFAVSATRPG